MRWILPVILSAVAACVPVPTLSVTTVEQTPAPELTPLRAGDSIAVIGNDED